MTVQNVLLVEDEAPKLAHLQNFLRENFPNLHLSTARSVNSALDAIEMHTPDLLLLDMSLPTFDIGDGESGGRPQGFGGIEVLRQMTFSEIKCAVIVVTGYEAFLRAPGKPVELSELKEELMAEFPGLMLGCVHYNSAYGEWKAQLGMMLQSYLAEEHR